MIFRAWSKRRFLGEGLFGALAVLLLSGFAWGAGDSVGGLEAIPQRPVHYLGGIPGEPLVSPEEQLQAWEHFQHRHYAPWEEDCAVLSGDLLWPFQWLEKRDIFGSNLCPRSPFWMEKQRNNARIDQVESLGVPGMAVQETNLRIFPTEEPVFFDPSRAGEGYPFDYVQNSTLKPFEPLHLSHRSADGAWIFAKASFASGWVDVRHLALLTPEQVKRWKALPLGVVLQEGLPLKDGEGNFLGVAKAGTLMPLEKTPLPGGDWEMLGMVRSPEGKGTERICRIPRQAGASMPWPFTSWNAMLMLEELAGEPYGWGGLVQHRDCSATVRDFFIPFGLWLPRNSRYQAQKGLCISLEGLSPGEKEALLRDKGRPFRTLVGMPGHIMLYVGLHGETPVVFHNTWGIKTLYNQEEGRYILGRALFSSLWLGKTLSRRYPGDHLLVHRITSLSFPWEPR